MKGSTYKRCKCRDADGKELGTTCPKLRRKDGSWNPRHGTWYFRLELDAGPGGKRRTIRRGGYETQDAAQEALDEAKAKEARGGNAQSRLTVGAYLDEWLKANKSLRRSTGNTYGQHITNHLKPHLGHIELDHLRVGHLTTMFAAIDADNEVIAKAAADRKRLRAEAKAAWHAKDKVTWKAAIDALAMVPPHRRPVGPATKQRIRAVLRSALSDALRQGLVAVNVAKLVSLESGKRPKALVWTAERVQAWTARYERELAAAREAAAGGRVNEFEVWESLKRPSVVMVWTPEQTGVFLDHAMNHRLYALFHLVAFRGLRRGEACGLRWEDLDLDAGALAVTTQRVMISWTEIEEGPLKSDASEDTIPLDAATVAVLRLHKQQQAADRDEWGEAWVTSGKVFTRENGEALHPDAAFSQFMRLAFEAGLPPIRLHDLRHGAATLMLAGGADMKLVQALLRHSSITITADTYTSVLPEVARDAAEAAAALVPRKANRKANRKVKGTGSGTGGLPSGSQEITGPTDSAADPASSQVDGGLAGGPPGTRTRNLWIKSPVESMPREDA